MISKPQIRILGLGLRFYCKRQVIYSVCYFGNKEYIELTDESDLSFLGVDSDFEHLLSGDIPTFDILDEYFNKDGGLTYD